MRSWQSGAHVGDYTLLSAVARGGMGEIWLARDSRSGTVVIKRLLEQIEGNGNYAHMMLDEARIAAQLHHPNIVRLLDLGLEGDTLYLVMEYLDGENLSVIARRARKSGERPGPVLVAYVGAQIARALEYAHQRVGLDGTPLRMVHRDVSPENVVVTYDGSAKLIDFGIARARGRSVVTTDGAIKGKLSYVSPEQARGEPLDGRSDVFSLGVSLFELASGRFFHVETDELAMYRRIVAGGPFPRLEAKHPEVPEALAAAVNRALAVRPDERASAAELALALEQLVQDSGLDAAAELRAWLKRAEPAAEPQAAPDAGSDEWFSNLPALDADGRLVLPPAPLNLELLATPAPSQTEPPLELARERLLAPVEAEPQAPTPARAAPRRAAGWLAVVVVLLGLAAAGAWRLTRPGLVRGTAAVLINSQPPGAEVRIGGRVVGRTPFAATNDWVGTTEFELKLPGHAVAYGRFEGGAEAAVDVTLKRSH